MAEDVDLDAAEVDIHAEAAVGVMGNKSAGRRELSESYRTRHRKTLLKSLKNHRAGERIGPKLGL